MIKLETLAHYLKVPCPGCSSPHFPLFTQLWEWDDDEIENDGILWFHCPRCEWTFDLRDHEAFWTECHKGPLNGDMTVAKPSAVNNQESESEESIKVREKFMKLFYPAR